MSLLGRYFLGSLRRQSIPVRIEHECCYGNQCHDKDRGGAEPDHERGSALA
jgi:hypothetical protein